MKQWSKAKRTPAPIEPTCCDWVGLLVEWSCDLHNDWPEGWHVMYDMTHSIPVSYCPFCGTKLPERPP